MTSTDAVDAPSLGGKRSRTRLPHSDEDRLNAGMGTVGRSLRMRAARIAVHSPSLENVFDPRRNGLNFVRLAMATGVIVWHSFPLTGHSIQWWPLRQLLGEVWVDGFFAISGFLIVSSWVRDPHAGRFLRARVLRIMPAFWVCLAATALIIAPLATHQFGPANISYILRNALLWMAQYDIAGSPAGVPYPGVWNGSLWTLFWEFCCYLAVLAVGAVGLLRWRWTVPVLFLGALAALVATAYGPIDNRYIVDSGRFGVMFAAGALMFTFSHRVPVRAWLLVVAGSLLAGSMFLPDYRVIGAIPLAYLVIVAGSVIRQPRLRLRNDISYGVYIYAFPSQQLLALSGLTDVGLFMLGGALLTLPLAIASWFLIEKPALRLKKVDFSRRRAERVGTDDGVPRTG